MLAACIVPDLVTLDICENYILTREFLTRMSREHPSAKARFLYDIHQRYMDYYFREVIKSVDGCYPHDAIAVACAIRPDLFTFERRAVDVVAEGNGTFGHTVRRPGAGPNARVAIGFDARAFENCLIKWAWG